MALGRCGAPRRDGQLRHRRELQGASTPHTLPPTRPTRRRRRFAVTSSPIPPRRYCRSSLAPSLASHPLPPHTAPPSPPPSVTIYHLTAPPRRPSSPLQDTELERLPAIPPAALHIGETGEASFALIHPLYAARPPPPGALEDADLTDDEDSYDW